jgi:hypothetical protein
VQTGEGKKVGKAEGKKQVGAENWGRKMSAKSCAIAALLGIGILYRYSFTNKYQLAQLSLVRSII